MVIEHGVQNCAPLTSMAVPPRNIDCRLSYVSGCIFMPKLDLDFQHRKIQDRPQGSTCAIDINENLDWCTGLYITQSSTTWVYEVIGIHLSYVGSNSKLTLTVI